MKLRLKLTTPWTSRSERKAQVAEAREQAAQSRENAARDEHITRDLKRMVADNHFAELIHGAITGRKPRSAGKLGGVMLETVTWRTWAAMAGAVIIYVALGMWLQHDDFAEAWLYRLGLTAAAIMPLVFTGIYTWFGFSKTRPAAKWWRTRLGTAIVVAALSLVPIAGPLAWVFWVDDGNLTAGWLAWIEVCGPMLSFAAWLWISWLWLRVRAGDS